MPIYEYACSHCGDDFEMLQPIGAEPPEACPTCGAADVRKKVSMTSFVLKGSGWYRDHYGLKSTGSESASASKPTSGSGADSKSSGSSTGTTSSKSGDSGTATRAAAK